ncbi:collagen-like triple helix repeat-containing protein [Catalinimonas niigatensis]|uniref:collagen-like triple helix repeat-containing protein n=1 Tax=Catalinimonas niigatensis TaxID=1397264 RepID=UPI0026659C7D|nr:collagen-like protein [Catalinimonas niigatensis]WPP51319.1 collagen-like protein [Catalinimonas niigatensis]
MKRLNLYFFFASLYVLSACEGPVGPEGLPGPQGPAGEDGLDGINILGQVFEVEGDFNAGNEYGFGFEFPADEVEVFESDAILVYISWDQIEVTDEPPINIWRLLPQSAFLEGGTLQYNYDHTFTDVNIFLDGTIDLSTLTNEYTQNQLFRIVIVPADYVPNARMDIDYSNYEDVIRTFGIDDTNVKRY